MDKLTKIIFAALGILSTAAALLQKAAELLTRFVTKNTPESALLLALGTIYQAWSTGNLPTAAAAIAAFSALMTFMVTESAKDGKAIQAATPPSP